VNTIIQSQYNTNILRVLQRFILYIGSNLPTQLNDSRGYVSG